MERFVSNIEALYIESVKNCLDNKKDDTNKNDDGMCGKHDYCKYCHYCEYNINRKCVDPEQNDANDINRAVNVIKALINGEPRPDSSCDCASHYHDDEDYGGEYCY